MTLSMRYAEMMAEGRAQGMAEGKTEGRMEGKVIVYYNDMKLSIEEIAEHTKLSVEKINKIISELKN